MTSTISPAQHPLTFSAPVENSDVDQDISLMLDLDDIFSEVVAAFDPVAPILSVGEGPATSALGTPNPLTPLPAPVTYVPVSPSSSCTELSDCAEVTAEPTKIAEMKFDAPVRISPNPSTKAPAKPSNTKQAVKKSSCTKKRRFSAIQNPEDEDEAVLEEKRRQRNRDHARKSRQRKKSLTGSLQNSLEELKAENARLREQIFAAIGKRKAEALVTARLASPSEKFVAALKKPENRVLDSDAISFLQSLRSKIAPFNQPVQTIA